MIHLLHFVGLTIHLTHHVEQMKKSQRISACESLCDPKASLDIKDVNAVMSEVGGTLPISPMTSDFQWLPPFNIAPTRNQPLELNFAAKQVRGKERRCERERAQLFLDDPNHWPGGRGTRTKLFGRESEKKQVLLGGSIKASKGH